MAEGGGVGFVESPIPNHQSPLLIDGNPFGVAEQIGADTKTVKYAALLHDMGKALTHKIEGKHHHIGAEIARKYGVPENVAHAIEAHHDDVEATTTEALVVRVVDAISAARPGARNISAENFAERMKEPETPFRQRDPAERQASGESRERYRDMVDSVSRIGENEIERALLRA